MNLILKKAASLVIVILFPLVFTIGENKDANSPEGKAVRDLDQIRNSGRMVVVTDFNSINYFIYKGRPMGFQYELLQELSDHLGIEIEVRVNNDLNANFQDLLDRGVDVIASNLTVTNDRKELTDFTFPHSETRQVIVQKPSTPDHMCFEDEAIIHDPSELAGKTVYVQNGSVHAQRLKEIKTELNLRFTFIEVPIETEQLIKMVSRGEIDYTVADENIALLNKKEDPVLNVEIAISNMETQAWVVRKESVELRNEISLWMKNFRTSRKYAILVNKYYKGSRTLGMINSDYYYPETGRISPYDEIFKAEAAKIDWDWKLLASMAYQESRFNPKARSWAGAFGIMQLMPLTASRFGVNPESPTASQIRASVSLIKWLDKQFENIITDDQERIKFILAAYNVGYGHVKDAMVLTEKYGRDPKIWEDNVEYYLLKKAEPEYYKDPDVRNGYARGSETYKYVKDILYRYNHYLNISEPVDIAQILE